MSYAVYAAVEKLSILEMIPMIPYLQREKSVLQMMNVSLDFFAETKNLLELTSLFVLPLCLQLTQMVGVWAQMEWLLAIGTSQQVMLLRALGLDNTEEIQDFGASMKTQNILELGGMPITQAKEPS